MKLSVGQSIFMGCVGCLSALVGLFFGALAADLYEGMDWQVFYGSSNPAGVLLGGLFGLLTGLVYSLFLIKFVHSGRGIIRAIVAGAVAGLVCSSMLHGVLILLEWNFNFGPMIMGNGFGIISGAAMGLVCGTIYIAGYNSMTNSG